MPESTHVEAPAEARAAGDWAPLCSRIKQVATEQPDVRPDMEPERFVRILSREKRPSTTDLALIAVAFDVTVPWLVTGNDEDADVLALLGREAKRARQEIAATDPQAGLADLKQRLKPTVGYIRVLPDCDPAQNPTLAWHQVSLPEARQGRDLAIKQESRRTIIVKVTTTFEIVEGGGRD